MRRLLLALLLCCMFYMPATGQTQLCRTELTQAEDRYTYGRFDEAMTWLQVCIEKLGVPAEEKARAYRLMALSYLGQDMSEEARSTVRTLLNLDPDYTSDPEKDPPAFTRMVSQFKAAPAPPVNPAEPAVNAPPVAVAPLEPLDLTLGQPPVDQDLSVIFADPEGEPLHFEAQATTPVVTVTVDGTRLRTTPGATTGTALVNVRATDPGGLQTTQSFRVAVVPAATPEDRPLETPAAEPEAAATNTAPRLVGALQPRTITVGGEGFQLDLAAEPAIFSDVEGDALQYTVLSEDVNVARAAVRGTTLLVAPGSEAGQTRVVITATDPDGLGTTAFLIVTTQAAPEEKKGSSTFRRMLYVGALGFVIYTLACSNENC